MKKVIFIIFFLLASTIAMREYVAEDIAIAESDVEQTILSEGKLQVHFLDIGQGDASFIQFADGQQMLVDCAIDARILEALGRVMPFYDHTIDYMLITHPDKDHYGGCIDVLERFDVANIVYTGVKKDQNFYREFEEKMYAEGAEYYQISGEETWNIASTSIQFLYPDHSVVDDYRLPGYEKDTGYNNTSIAFLLEHNGRNILFTGDAEEEEEEYLIDRYGEALDVDILKAGHHGSAGASIPEFLSITSPEHVVFSAGKDNQYGHPSRRVLKRVERVSSTVWRTDMQGDIHVVIGEDITIESLPTL
ncbi:MBL fold metallo-hydrolase [Patescibacteria group bacterium]|nr:MBL fold metallo-hydrolase [Patescibacteria group bacterium]MBU1721738.1 MBL fold metallo-hydrolase [Patescibacteria group bacterium]MBU1901423.1 MBL fold metallo-hydrolase [Patescibacteria group bacterium]